MLFRSEELVIKPTCSAGVAGNTNFTSDVSSTIKVHSDPAWVVSSLGLGSNHYGALSSITVTMQPNWELEYPTEITVCCVEGFQVPDPDGGEKIAVFNEDAQIFDYEGTFDETTGRVMLRIAEDMTLPCSKPSVISFQLRNFRDRTSLDLPGNLTAMGPLGFFGASLAADPPGPAASPAGFRWLYRSEEHTSELQSP